MIVGVINQLLAPRAMFFNDLAQELNIYVFYFMIDLQLPTVQKKV